MPDGGALTFGSAILPGAGGRRAGDPWSPTPAAGWTRRPGRGAFEPYFTTKGPGRGTGLGLASVATLARRNGVDHSSSTARPDEGSRFTVTIPLPAGESTPG